MTYGLTGACQSVFSKVSYSNCQTCHRTHSHDEFRRKTTHFSNVWRSFCQTLPCLRKFAEKGHLFIEFRLKRPTHLGGTHPYRQQVVYLLGFFPEIFILLCIWPMLRILTLTFLSSFSFKNSRSQWIYFS